MKLLNNILGLGYIAYTLFTIRRYKKLIERLKQEGRKEEQRQAIAEVCHIWSDKVAKHFKTNIKVINPENLPEEGPCVYVSNHQSYADILVLLNVIKHQTGFIAKEELASIPVFSKWILRIGSLFILRGDARESLKTISEGVDMIKDGYSLVIFPAIELTPSTSVAARPAMIATTSPATCTVPDLSSFMLKLCLSSAITLPPISNMNLL
jgi:1-acyl-sn-glycerol-3-phosphate acyltransferase